MTANETQLLGVIGWPIAQSKSPAMQQAALEALGMEGWRYVPFALPPERLEAAIAGAQALGIRGLNVTIPHKESVLALCEPDALAREVGAVNTLSFEEDGRIRGTNTDVHGLRMLLGETGIRPGRRALILGAGGAARAVVVALRTAGWGSIAVVSRSGKPLRVGEGAVPGLAWNQAVFARELAKTDLLVDATPRGLDPSGPQLDLGPLGEQAAVLDLVVKRETPLVASARARGLKAATGTAMLLHQGAAALEYWTGVAAPLEVMREALEDALD